LIESKFWFLITIDTSFFLFFIFLNYNRIYIFSQIDQEVASSIIILEINLFWIYSSRKKVTVVITANKISNETKTISKEVGTRDISTGLQKLQRFLRSCGCGRKYRERFCSR